MLPPDYLEHIADDILNLYTQLDQSIVRDIVRRLIKTGRVTDTAAWQIQKAQESGLLYTEVVSEVSRITGASENSVKALFEDAGVASIEYDSQIYEAAGLSPPPLPMSPTAYQVLNAGITKTNGYLTNLTMTTANQAQQAYIKAATLAEMQVESGAFSYNAAIKNAVHQAAKEGAWVQYPTGHRDRIDVAVRRAVLTGVGQTTGEISLSYAQDMGCDLMEITAHAGARPEHAVWQGKIVSLSGRRGYLSLSDIGYGTGPGFKGWNCRHDWFPFFEGLSSSAYPREKLEEFENRTVSYNGQKIPYYDATQMQRAMERRIRATKRDLAGFDEAMKNGLDMRGEFNTASVKLKRQEAALKDFLNQTGLMKDSARTQALGFGRSQAQKAVWANKNLMDIRSDAIIKAASKLPKTVKLPDELLKQTADVDFPLLHGVVPKGSAVTNVVVIAGKGTSVPLRDVKRLYTQYPEAGGALGWQKKTGVVIGQNFSYEVHWYENKGVVPMGEIKTVRVKKRES